MLLLLHQAVWCQGHAVHAEMLFLDVWLWFAGKQGPRAGFSGLFKVAGWGSPKGAKGAGAGADLEAAELAMAGSSSAEQAFRIWSLPNEGAFTSDPYSKVGGSIERNEGKPPSRPG